jgi:hypothetical protein
VAAPGGKFATPDDLHAAVRSWLVAYDTAEEREAALAEVCVGEGSVTFDDLVEWIGSVRPRRAADLIQAARVVLTEVRWEMASAEPGRMAAQPLTPLPVEELEEALLALDGVSLPGVNEDWLFDYMTDFVKRDGYSITRPGFVMAMRLATPRQVAALQRQDRLERARAAAMASDAERARPTVQPELAQPEREEETIAEKLARWSETAGGQAGLNEMLAETTVRGWPMVGQFPRWYDFRRWAGDDALSSLQVRDALRAMATMPKVAPLPAESQAIQPAIRGQELEIERKEINQGKAIKLYGRNQDGTLTVTVNVDGLHLYSPGMTLTLEDAYNLTVMMQRAMGQMHMQRRGDKTLLSQGGGS